MQIGSAQLSTIEQASSKLFQTIGEFNLPGGFVFSPTYLQAGAVVFCMFLLILTFGMLQHRYNHWTIKGIMPGVVLGFVLAISIESMLLVGGRTIFTELLGWENAPKPISNALEASRGRLADVLGVAIPESKADAGVTVEGVMQSFEALGQADKAAIREYICPWQ